MALALAGCTQAANDSTPPAAAPDTQIDLIIAGDNVVTMDAAGDIYQDAAVAIDDGVIIAIGPRADIETKYTARETLDGERRVVMPGLINGHTHAAMTLLRGVADDLALMDWLQNYIFPAEVEFVDPEFVRVGTELACWEMIRGGTTTFVDMYYFPDTIADVVDKCGMRALISATVIDQRSPDAEDAADSIRKGSEFIERWQGRNGRITPIFGPHSDYTLDKEDLRATREAALHYGVPVSIHLSESPY
ncbi:MAG: amidohydrolase family protein, partial [Woeseiaceae bacterium]